MDIGKLASIANAALFLAIGLPGLVAHAADDGDVPNACDLPLIASGDEEAKRICRELAEQGNADAQFELGMIYGNARGVPQDYAEGLRWIRTAAEQAHAPAQFTLGIIYEKGQGGIAQDFAEAIGWYHLAAEQGHADAQNALAHLYDIGGGVTQDYAEALRWFRMAAEQEHAGAQFSLGYKYEKGHGVAQDYAEALRWYHRAADKGDVEILLMLAQGYELGSFGKGLAGKVRLSESTRWNRLAAEQGDATAQSRLGGNYSYENSLSLYSIEPNDVLAHMWYNLAASQLPPGEDRDDAVKERRSLERLMSTEEVAEAQRLAREWRPKTWEELSQEPFAKPPDIDLVAQSDSDDDPQGAQVVTRVQEGLAALGYAPGPADGIAGRRTRAAIRAFESDMGLPVSGWSDDLVEQIEAALQSLDDLKPASPTPEAETAEAAEVPDPIEALLAEADTPYRFDIPLSQTQVDAIRSQIQRNWNVPAGALGAHEMKVTLRLQLGRDGTIERVEVVEADRRRMLTDGFFRTMAESVVRAVRKTGQIKYLSLERYEQWRDIKVTFDPKEMYG